VKLTEFEFCGVDVMKFGGLGRNGDVLLVMWLVSVKFDRK
jgi:hypothetical protein